jgi:hypothetical protein
MAQSQEQSQAQLQSTEQSQSPVVTTKEFSFAASILGTKILSCNPQQILVESDQSFLSRFTIHELNRNVDENWVHQMKVEIMKNAMAQECMTLTLAIDERMIQTAMAEPEGDIHGGFKAIVLDGQHRLAGMKQLVQEMPSINFKIWLIVYIVKNDQEILNRLETLNKRRNFSDADNIKILVTKHFLEAFEAIHRPAHQSRRCIMNVRKSPILKSDAFIKKHRLTTVDKFESKIRVVSEMYKARAEECEGKKGTLFEVIKSTGLHQLIDNSCNWLMEL